MKDAVIIHGCPEKEDYYNPKYPSESNAHWLPWLQRELMIRDIHASTPEVPHSYEPRWDLWVRELKRYELGEDTLLVGHSAGAGFLVKYLSIHPELKVGRVVLVAPWLDPDDTIEEKSFFEFEPDARLVERTAGIDVLYATDDSKSIQDSVAFLKRSIEGLRYHEFPDGYGHFTYDNLKGPEFPEIRDLILNAP